MAIPNVPAPRADGPKLGAIANLTPVFDRPGSGAKQIGYLHAGATVVRAGQPYGAQNCPQGWFPIRPRGFVCTGATATTDLSHPTLLAMALAPKLDATLPYTYARLFEHSVRYQRDPKREDGVVEVDELPGRSAMAIVGSWTAKDPAGKELRLGMMTNGQFISAERLKPAPVSEFKGVELSSDLNLPLAYILKRGVHAWKLNGQEPDRVDELDYHHLVPLTGRFRTLGDVRYWAARDGRWVRHRDVTVVRERNVFPEFAKDGQKWIDISIATETLVLYEGKKAIFATLVSAGRDRLENSAASASTQRGTFEVVAKHVTAVSQDPKSISPDQQIYDLPWSLELSSGQLIHGAFWHDRFGIEEGLGSLQLSPADAARVWQWVEPALPVGWHGAALQSSDKKTYVVIRK
jgi:hypothetical protein